VQDNGIGMSAETQGRLFESFVQGERTTTRRFGGTGLGLAISRQLVILMGGTLAVQSVEGVGTEFTVDLQLPVANTVRDAALAPGMIPGSRVLVACGLALTRQSIAEILARHGLVAETVADHSAMVSRLRGGSGYAFVIADAPSVGDGSQPVLGGMRNPPPLVLLTSLHQPLNNSTLSATGAAAQLRRPVREDHLVSLLDDLVAGRLQLGGAVARATERTSPHISDATLVAAARASGSPVMPSPTTPAATASAASAATAASTPATTAPAAGATTNAPPAPNRPASTLPPGATLRADAVHEGKPRVLVVDDVELNLMVARAMIGSLGAHVVSANGGMQAIQLLEKDRYALVLMDCHMPEIDGYEATRRVRAAVGPNQTTPIVALSASAFAEDRQRALESGMNDFAPKPIELNGLRSVLGRWIPGFQPAGPKAESAKA
jgi:CheY-like chemotaxis protein